MSKNKFNSSLFINIDNLLNNLQKFNDENGTSFSKNTSLETIQKYFHEQYFSFINELTPQKQDAIYRFNDLFIGFAYILK